MSSCIDYGAGKEVLKSSHVSGGPWGGEGGSRWDDGVYCSVRQVIITHGAVIDSIQLEYDTKAGCSVWSEKHGAGGGIKTDKLKLDHPDEHLLSVSGFYGAVSACGPVVVRSLLFETNYRRRFGPFGSQKGNHFSFSLTGGKIVGFFGRSGLHLDSLGVYLKPLFVNVRTAQPAQGVAHLGVAGGNRGYDIMVAVREKMDNNMLLNAGGFGEYDRKEKVYTSEGVEGNLYNGKVGREREKFMSVTNQAYYKDSDQAYEPADYRDTDHRAYRPAYEDADQGYNYHAVSGKVILTSHPDPRGVPLGGRQGAREKESTMAANHDHTAFRDKYETREKVYTNVGAEKGYNLNIRQNDGGNIYTRNNGYTEYETKEKVYNTGSAQNPLVSPTKGRPAVSYGPWGGSGGMLFDDGVFTGVREIHLSRTATGGVVSIRVCYDMNGQAVWGNKNGGTGAIRVDKITLDYPDEVLTCVSGYYGSTVFRGPTVVKSLTFLSNKQKYGPFGDEQGIPFSSGQKEGIVVGFHGRKGWFLDSIGVHFLEAKYSLPIPRTCFDMYTTTTTTDTRFTDQVFPGPVKVPIPIPSGPGPLPAAMVKEPAPCGPGPWGGSGGTRWDDGVFTGIKKIFLTKGYESICAIQIEYDSDGKSTWSAKHGNNNEGSCHVIKFEYPQEVLSYISGYYGSVGGDECKSRAVKSLTFHTNRRVYGPYGEEIGTHFTSATAIAKTQQSAKVVGFHGNSGCHLYAIGVHTLTDRPDPGPIKTMLHKIFAN